MRSKFQNLNEMFLKNSKNVEELVISKKPKKPVRTPGETDEEYNKKYKGNSTLWEMIWIINHAA